MKVLVLAVLCVIAGVQGRSGVVPTTTIAEHPHSVHIRLAIGTSGLLNSCAGSLIHGSWVLTSNSCVNDSRFLWLRYGALRVVNPEMVTETSAVRRHLTADIALVSINRFVQPTSNIRPVGLWRDEASPDTADFCGYGQTEQGGAGEYLTCREVQVSYNGDSVYVDEDFTQFDNGGALVAGGVQFAVKSGSGNEFVRITPEIIRWIEAETNLQF